MTIAWVDNTGAIISLTSDDGLAPASGLAPISPPPEHGRQVWDFATKMWGPKPPTPPDPDDELDAALAVLPASAAVPDLVGALRAWLARRAA